MSAVVSSLEDSLELLCITGVEDQLQTDVRPTLELLKNAGIRVKKIFLSICTFCMLSSIYAGVPQPVAIIAIGEDANTLAITRRQQEPSWPSRISRVYDGTRAASTRVMCTYNIIIQVDQNQWRRVLVVADRL